MNKRPEHHSTKEIERKTDQDYSNKLKEKSDSDSSHKPHKLQTLAQAIPTLPESKFFPSSGRNLHLFQGHNQKKNIASANISTTNSANNSLVSPINLSVQKRSQNNSELNFSLCTPKNSQAPKLLQWTDIALPTSPANVLRTFSNKLTSFEQSEILKYPAVYCIGIDSKKIKTSCNAANYGFDDDNGDYRTMIKDHIAYRYEVYEIIGKGSFGQVLRVFDYKRQCFCALKIIRNKSRFHQQAAIEIDILKVLRYKDEDGNHNIVHIQSSFNFRNHIVRSI